MENQEVFTLLRNGDKIRCLQTLRSMAETDAASATSALLAALNTADEQLRRRSAWALAILPLKKYPDVVDAFCILLKNDPSEEIRLQCAIGLMRAKTIEVRDAYIHAVHDPNEKVAMIACGQLLLWEDEESAAALYGTLSSRSWRVRLEACKSLITLKAADKRVVSALEKMSKEREAKKYNAQMEEFAKIPFQMPGEPEIKTWGKIETILEQARQIAALND